MQNSTISPGQRPAKRRWTVPVVEDLAALRDLTLQSATPVGGNEGGFTWLDAVDLGRRLG